MNYWEMLLCDLSPVKKNGKGDKTEWLPSCVVYQIVTFQQRTRLPGLTPSRSGPGTYCLQLIDHHHPRKG